MVAVGEIGSVRERGIFPSPVWQLRLLVALRVCLLSIGENRVGIYIHTGCSWNSMCWIYCCLLASFFKPSFPRFFNIIATYCYSCWRSISFIVRLKTKVSMTIGRYNIPGVILFAIDLVMGGIFASIFNILSFYILRHAGELSYYFTILIWVFTFFICMVDKYVTLIIFFRLES